jgi:hypothetical protein
MLLIIDDALDFSIEDTSGESYIMCRSCADALDRVLARYLPSDFTEIWLDYNLGGPSIEAAVLALEDFAAAPNFGGRSTGLPKIRVLTDDPEGFDFIEAHLANRYEFIEPPESCNELWLERRKD